MNGDWTRAACLGMDPEAWSLPEGSGRHWDDAGMNKLAMRICRTCPVRTACARYALDAWPVGLILAGVPVRHNGHGGRSPRSLAALERIARAT